MPQPMTVRGEGSSLRSAPAGPRGGLLGLLPEMRRDPLKLIMDLARQGDVVRYRYGPVVSHLVTHPDGVRRILQDNVRNYTKEHFSYGMVRWVAGNGLLTSMGDFWLRQRRLAQPAFHRQRIAALATTMTDAIEAMLERWPALAAGDQPLDVAEQMTRLTLQVAGESLFGTQVGERTRTVSESFTTLNEQFVYRFRRLRVLPPVLPFGLDREWREALRSLDGVVYAIIAERRASGEDAGDLLSMLMLARDEETGERMDDRQLRDEVLTMLVAGHETTAVALSWAFAMLALHPDVEERLHAELESALGGRKPTVPDLSRLGYARQVIEETMRLYPPIYVLSRAVKEDDEICGYRIPGGTSADISPYATHRHPAFWENPEAFDPERFAPARVDARPRFAYLPFSGGPRQCIGNSFALVEAQLTLAMIAQRYRLRLAPGHRLAPEPLLSLRPRGGMPMLIEARRR